MIIFWSIFLIILTVLFVRNLSNKPSDDDSMTGNDCEEPNEEFINEYPIQTTTVMQTQNENQTEREVVNTKGLMIETLRQMGCDPKEIEDGAVGAVFQGEKFYMRFGGWFVNIWDLGWSSINVNDLNLPKLRKAINLANFEFGPTIVLTDPDENGVMDIHTRYGILLHPSLPDLTEYLANTFNMFFKAKNNLHLNYNRLIVEQENQHSDLNRQDMNPCTN